MRNDLTNMQEGDETEGVVMETMTKSDTIADIKRLNRSADFEFLSEFSQPELAEYLFRLRSASATTLRVGARVLAGAA